MSSIQKIAIQGMRSFGPDDGDKQILTFFTPLTLILGANGTGKTTIIECLKYITTGDMPPNSGRGGNFVFDPQLANEIEVKGQVKLQMRDVTNKSVVVTRSLMLTRKRKKTELKTIDGTLQRTGHDGRKTSLSIRCADLNKEMISCLGVTKPILNHVIFCHQEESNWPLSEGKALKQKFDDIFAATRYIKALDVIQKIRKETNNEQKVHAGEMKYLVQNKEQANKIKKKLSETENYLAASKDKINKIHENLQPLEEKLESIALKEKEIGKLQTDLVKKKTQFSEIEKTACDLRGHIQNLFVGDNTELEEAIRDFKKKMTERNSSITQLEQEIIKKNKEYEKLGVDKSKLLFEIGKLKVEDQQQKNKITSRDKKIENLCKEYNLGDTFQNQNPLSDNEVDDAIRLLNRELESIEEEGNEKKTRFEEKEITVQNKMDKLRDSKTKLEHSIKTKSEQINANKTEMRKLQNELILINSSAGRLDQLTSELRKAEEDLLATESSLNVALVRNEIETFKKQQIDLDTDLKKLDAEMQRMHLQSSTQAELDLHHSDKNTKMNLVKKLMNKHEETLTHLLGRLPDGNIHYEVDKLKQKLNDDIKSQTAKCQSLNIKLSTAESKRNMLMKQLSEKENELKSQEEEIFQICGSQNFDSGLESLEKSIKEIQDENGALVGTRYVYSKFVEKLERKDSPCCPLCHREFDEPQDVTDLINDLNSKMRLIPSQLDNKAKIISVQQQKFNSMLQLKPVKTRMENLRSQDIPQLQQTVKDLALEIEKYNKEIKELEEDLEVKQIDEATVSSIQGDMVSLDQAQSDIKKLEKKISVLEHKLIGGDKNRSLKQVTLEKEKLQRQADVVKHDLEERREKLSDYNELLQENRERLNDLRNEKLKIESQLQGQRQLQDKCEELKVNDEECKKIIQNCREQMKPLEGKLEEARKEKEDVIFLKEETLKKIQQRVIELKTKIRDVQLLHDEIERYVKNGGEEKLNSSSRKLLDLEKTLQKKEEERIRVINKLEQTRKEITTQQIRERELSDNLQLRRQEEQLETLKTEIERLQQSIGGHDVQTLLRTKRQLTTEIEQLNRERSHADGRQRELKTNVASLKVELQSDMYKDADEKHKSKLIELRMTEIVYYDLQLYYTALDRAIMKHHTMKMKEINEIIRELWRNTYRGNDIDFIEIRSDEGDSPTKSNQRRVYHYRVVMVKGDVILDMRGRCSAGQKVLASIIIRLALAETFGLNFGVLALDEPTTNLDRENIDSLADALINIVKARQKQANFQLLVITHDEEFLERLGRSEFVDYYYRIEKSHTGRSTIQKCSTTTIPI